MRIRTRGFTLVEVLVALLVLALIAAMGWQGIDGIMRTRDASRERLEATLRLNTALAQWQADLDAVQPTPAVPGLAFDGRTLRLVRRAEGGLQVVAWSLQDPAPGETGRRWMRWAGRPVTSRQALQDQWFASQQLLGNEPGQLRVAGGLSGWQVFFWREGDNGWSSAQSSGDVGTPRPPAGAASAPRPQGDPLPRGVRLVLQFDGGGLAGNLMRDLTLAPQGS